MSHLPSIFSWLPALLTLSRLLRDFSSGSVILSRSLSLSLCLFLPSFIYIRSLPPPKVSLPLTRSISISLSVSQDSPVSVVPLYLVPQSVCLFLSHTHTHSQTLTQYLSLSPYLPALSLYLCIYQCLSLLSFPFPLRPCWCRAGACCKQSLM